MKSLIIEYLQQENRKMIDTKDIEKYLENSLGLKGYEKRGGYEKFARKLGELVEAGEVAPIKSWQKNALLPELYNGYRLLSSPELSNQLKKKLLTSYHPALNTSYYLDHPEDYSKDKRYLDLLNKFLKENQDLAPMSVNERSFQIFGDEKWLDSKQGPKFLQRIALTLEDLNCHRTSEPFFYYAAAVKKPSINTLIIENKDTFSSFKSLVQQGLNSWAGRSFQLLIYGEGKKIECSFPFFYELEEYALAKTNFYYFGDLDPEGIMIWWRLNNIYAPEFKPAIFFYQTLLDKFSSRAPKLRTEQKLSTEALKDFSAYFSKLQIVKLKKLMLANKYLPQEALNYSLLKKLSQ